MCARNASSAPVTNEFSDASAFVHGMSDLTLAVVDAKMENTTSYLGETAWNLVRFLFERQRRDRSIPATIPFTASPTVIPAAASIFGKMLTGVKPGTVFTSIVITWLPSACPSSQK